MHNAKRLLATLVLIAFSAGFLTSCESLVAKDPSKRDSGKPKAQQLRDPARYF
ncbi:hypothetical protein BH23VER1_BH23VER1_12270 [soil metagenome]